MIPETVLVLYYYFTQSLVQKATQLAMSVCYFFFIKSWIPNVCLEYVIVCCFYQMYVLARWLLLNLCPLYMNRRCGRGNVYAGAKIFDSLCLFHSQSGAEVEPCGSAHYTHDFGVSICCSNKCFCEVLGNMLTQSHRDRKICVYFMGCNAKSQKVLVYGAFDDILPQRQQITS